MRIFLTAKEVKIAVGEYAERKAQQEYYATAGAEGSMTPGVGVRAIRDRAEVFVYFDGGLRCDPFTMFATVPIDIRLCLLGETAKSDPDKKSESDEKKKDDDLPF